MGIHHLYASSCIIDLCTEQCGQVWRFAISSVWSNGQYFMAVSVGSIDMCAWAWTCPEARNWTRQSTVNRTTTEQLERKSTELQRPAFTNSALFTHMFWVHCVHRYRHKFRCCKGNRPSLSKVNYLSIVVEEKGKNWKREGNNRVEKKKKKKSNLIFYSS